jgi:peptide/nickel transport system substrate-binding protein
VAAEERNVPEPAFLSRRQLLQRGAGGVAILALPGSLLSACGSSSSDEQVTPRSGGRLRVAFVGGGSAETLDPHGGNTNIDTGRATVLYEKLFDQYGPKGVIGPTLADSIESNKTADEWTIRLKPDVQWHNGKTLSADDVLYTFNRILDPKNKLGGAADISFIDPRQMRKLDALTVRLGFHSPIADPTTAFASRFLPIIQDGFTDFRNPIGTGPFQFKSWTPGKQSLFVAYADYRVKDLPHVDELEYVSIPDSTARFNALRSGQVHATENLATSQAIGLAGNANVKVLSSATGGMVTMVMDTTKAPFDDIRVRQAFRLLVDREQMVKNALSDFGRVGNDLFSPFDPLYDSGLPHRTYDPEQAKALLKQAGKEGLQIDLQSSTAAPGMLESAQAYAEQSRKGGITVQVKQGPADSYYTDRYMKFPFFQTQWGNYPLDSMIALSTQSKAPYNEARYANPAFDKLWNDARSTLDEGPRTDKYHELQRMLHDEGGYIIWGFANTLDGYRSNVHGLRPNPARPLGFFNFKDVWLS